jgi:alpha-mannosidase
MTDELRGVSRRAFLFAGSTVVGSVAIPSWVIGASPAPATAGERKVLHIIGHSHIDAAWLWPWRDGENEVFNTFRSALNRIQETPDFRYSHSSAAHYRWVERADPAMYAEIKQRVQEGRWEVVGGWPVEPDCNIPSAESFARHCLYGKAFLERTLGASVNIGFNPDSFGHAAGLPTILKHAGYRYYVFQRPGDKENSLPHIFWWEGPDGSRVLANRIWKGYDEDAEDILGMVDGAFVGGFNHATFFLGVGDHGGAVTKAQIKNLLEMRADPKLPELRFSTLREFFTAVEASPAMAKVPVVHGELQHHARGCYSAYGEGKYQNRRAERSLVHAETISVVAAARLAHGYPRDLYSESWSKVLFCQFHDMLAGTSQYPDYQDVRDSVGFACEAAQTNKIEALEALARNVDMRTVQEGAVFCFNSLPWARKALLEFHTDDNPSGTAPITRLTTQSGQSIPIQWRPPDNMSQFLRRLSAWVDIPPLGYKVFELAHGSAPTQKPPPNSYKHSLVTPSEVGFGISSLKAADETELLSAPIDLIVISDTSDTWAHGINQFRQEMGRPMFVSSSVIENGPVTKVTRQRARWGTSEIVLDIAQFVGFDVTELRFVIDWREHEQILKLEIPSAFAAPKVYAKVPGAIIERTTNGEEEPYQDWVALEGVVGHRTSRTGVPYTLALLNNSTYSYDCLNGLLRTILIRSAPFARHNPAQVPHNDANAWQDQGRQERRFWLIGARGACALLALDRRAEELQTPAEHIADSAHGGTQPWEQSFLEISPDSIWVLAIKQAEAGEGTLVRMQERSGRATRAALKSAVLGLDHSVEFNPWELKTVLVHPAPGGQARLREVSILET